jgi:hypothetical protein
MENNKNSEGGKKSYHFSVENLKKGVPKKTREKGMGKLI